MPAGLEVIAGQATAPSATFTALTMNAGNTLTVRNAALATDVRLINMWAKNQVAGVFRVRSPKLHDNVQGIRMRNPSASAIEMLPWNTFQKLVPQDNLVAEITGSAVAGQFEQGAMLLYYADLPGQMARLTTITDVQRRGQNLFTVESTITPSALTPPFGDSKRAKTARSGAGLGPSFPKGSIVCARSVSWLGLRCGPSRCVSTSGWF